jgi:hypothetical protein
MNEAQIDLGDDSPFCTVVACRAVFDAGKRTRLGFEFKALEAHAGCLLRCHILACTSTFASQ